jgi:DNA repair photolyase
MWVRFPPPLLAAIILREVIIIFVCVFNPFKETQMKITVANPGRILTKTGFYEYDYCLNPYVGCRFGCAYCYVRFFLKDDKPWGAFVRTRDHLPTKLPNELKALPLVLKKRGKVKWTGPPIQDARIVMGTMTDPYQPIEKTRKLTRKALEILLAHKPKMVGLFTRSPLAARDIDLFQKIPLMRIHVTITPLPQNIKKRLEPVPVTMKVGLQLVEKLKQAGVETHVNIAPALPTFSEQYTKFLAEEMARLKVDQFFLDPMQPYKDSLEKVSEILNNDPGWSQVKALMSDKKKYIKWKEKLHADWMEAWDQSKSPDTLAIACDHERDIWRDMHTGKDIPH